MILDGLIQGVRLLVGLDPEVWAAVRVSLTVALTSTVLATLLGLPLGLAVGLGRFPLRRAVVATLNSLMALPTVLVGLVVYALLSRSGPLGAWEMLYTPAAMVFGQTILACPLIAALAAASLEKADPRILQAAWGLGAGRLCAWWTVAREMRAALVAAVVAGFGRVFAEVGLSMMVGGNIRGHTRSITTGIAFETGKGEFALGVALGLVLLAVALALNAGGTWLQLGRGRRA